MKRFYQTEWFGIPFDDFADTDYIKIADAEFYDKFYQEFYKRFSSYDDLPDSWLKEKKMIADFILCQSNTDDRLLSIGCGIGYIENQIKKAGRNIAAIEPSKMAVGFLKKSSDIKVYTGFFPACLESGNCSENYNLIYAVAVDYVFDNREFIYFLNQIKNKKPDKFMLINVSCYENGSLCRSFKEAVKSILASMNLYKPGQFWGYQRRPIEVARIFRTLGFENIKSGFLKGNIFWITAGKL